MRVLALEPYYGGSHQAFLAGWIRHSQHTFTLLHLPAHKWKWRMRHAALTFADQLRSGHGEGSWDVVWCSDMLNLAEFTALAGRQVQDLPRVVYFHENQLTYPVRRKDTRDLHFAFTNFVTALTADEVWFNSQFHQDDFLNALHGNLSRMPDFSVAEKVAQIEAKSFVLPPAIEPGALVQRRRSGPLRICWNARWEHDKNPDDFFAALRRARSAGVTFRLIVLGESFRNVPDVFDRAKQDFVSEIEHWGFADSIDAYRQWLQSADVVVSTADHEFFGIGIVEAISAGAFPLVPKRLAYPEIVAGLVAAIPQFRAADFLYDGSVEELARRIGRLSSRLDEIRDLGYVRALQASVRKFSWEHRATELDARLRNAVARP